ncbi:hypothetical protein FHG66_02135 [Rubellimicrobium rubrum]|uniref:DUF11 domain-containing protein n=1 Tax=Rubellimicrobium rubrum TaxID=2585369 RepID=A0A5C4N5P2_9RHOB|nr:hypothetical protein [Rubellimicrobium rubrum]TNC52362.1 hypothetical protein FHG66_02135 [Rubellimicrobium rubrum]
MTSMRLLATALAALMAFPLHAQDAAPAPAAPPAATEGVQAGLRIEVLKPTLDESGQPVLDASGQPVLGFQPVAYDLSLLPGDEFRYIAELVNDGPDAEAIEIGLDVPSASRLLPETVVASTDAVFELGSTTDATLRLPLFVEVDGASVPNPEWAATPERFDRLYARIQRIPSEQTATVTYHLVVR